jgi:hypothetical protein
VPWTVSAGVLDQIQLPGERVVVPLERAGQECEHLPFVGAVEVVELFALGFENGDPLGFTLALDGEDEVRIDPGLLPALYAVLPTGDVAVPPGERLFPVEVDGHVPLIAVQLVLIDGRKQALLRGRPRSCSEAGARSPVRTCRW